LEGVVMNRNEALNLWHAIGLDGEPSDLNSGLYGRVVNITPEVAQNILDIRNSNNRPIKISSAREWAIDMAEDRWMLTSATIAFDSTGTLADGQHRLKAICIAQSNQQILVILGVEPTAKMSIDQNVPRNIRDIMTLIGHKQPPKLAQVVKNLSPVCTRRDFRNDR